MPKNSTQNLINNLVKKTMRHKAKILDDFCEAYFASRWDDYFCKQKKIDFKRIELVEQTKNNEIIFFFRLKKGRLAKIHNKRNKS